ncbi:class I SAM-dependent methyltransferase [Anabaena sp. FACHB-1391]|nr:class I SAM-dependent methyltransferase [Anabaena sp. FACHB-1391]
MIESIPMSILSTQKVNCPVCSTTCFNPPLYRYTSSNAASHFCPTTRNLDRYHRLEKVIRKLWEGDECVILQCPQCGFAFGYPFVGGDEEFYQILHEQKGYPSWRWDYDIAIQEAITPFGGGKILEVGAGAGIFLRSLGQEWQSYAMEGSETTRTDLESAGIFVLRDLSEISQSEIGTFQVIVIFQVLEHIAEFHSVLKQCRQLLAAGGKIVITVPDGEAMIRQERITGCPDMPPNHINKWTPNSLSLALKQAGFIPQSSISEPNSWSNFRGYLHLRVISDATNSRSIAAQVYRIQNKRLRSPLLAFLGLFALIRMLPYFSELSKGGAFAMIAVAQ